LKKSNAAALEEVQDLLELDTIACDGREVVRELRPQDYSIVARVCAQ
jgi:hypothetical protein